MRRWRHFVTPVCCVRCAVTVFSTRIKIHRVSRWFFSFGRLALILPGARIRRPGSHATFTCCPSTRPFRYLVLPRLPRSFFFIKETLSSLFPRPAPLFCASAKPFFNHVTIAWFSFDNKTCPRFGGMFFAYNRLVTEPERARCRRAPPVRCPAYRALSPRRRTARTF